MIGTLFRLDPSIRGTWALLLYGLLGGSLLRSVATRLPEDVSSLDGGAGAWMTFSLGVAWFSCLLILLFQNCGTRTSRFYLGLPLAARTLWWVRMVSLLYAGVLPVLLATVVVSVRFREGSGFYFEPFFLLLGAKACAGLILAALLFQSPQPPLHRIPPTAPYLIYVGFFSLLNLLFVLFAPVSIIPVIASLGVALVIAVSLYRSIPDAFLVSPAEPGGKGLLQTERREETVPFKEGAMPSGATRTPPKTLWNGRWVLHRTIFRVLLGHWHAWVFIPLILMYSILLWDAYETTRDPLPILLFVTVWPFVLAYQAIIRLCRLDHLPISRQVLFPYVFLSATLPIFLGIGIGALTLLPMDRSDCLVCYGSQGIEVPPEFWEIAWDGRAPSITSPWGESFQPASCRIYPGSKLAVYLPYETREGLSPRFMAWQAARAVTAVHGRASVSEREIAEDARNPLVEQMERRHEFRRGFPIEVSIEAGSEIRSRVWLLGAVGVIWFCGLMAFVWILQFRLRRCRVFLSGLFFAMISLWAGLLMVHFLGPLFGVLHPMSPLRFPLVLLRHFAEGVSLGPGTLWVLIGASLAFVYLLLNTVFQGIEAPLGKVRPVWKEYG